MKVKGLSLSETIKEKSTFRAKALCRKVNNAINFPTRGLRPKRRFFLYFLRTFECTTYTLAALVRDYYNDILNCFDKHTFCNLKFSLLN